MNHGWPSEATRLGLDGRRGAPGRPRRRRGAPRRWRATAPSATAPESPARRSSVTPAGDRRHDGRRAGPGSTRTMRSPGPMSRKPLASKPGDQVGRRVVGAAAAQTCGWRPSDGEQDERLGQAAIERVRIRRPAEPPRAGSRTAPGRSDRGAGWHRPRSRSSRPGMAWTRASWRSSRRIVPASISRGGPGIGGRTGRHRLTIAGRARGLHDRRRTLGRHGSVVAGGLNVRDVVLRRWPAAPYSS